MQPKTAARVAWTLWVIAVAGILYGWWLGTVHPPLTQEGSNPLADLLWASAWIGFGFVGALIVSRRPTNSIGWVLCAITTGVATALFGPSYARAAYETAGGLPLGSVVTWIAAWAFIPAASLVVLLLLLFPTGELRGRFRRSLAICLGMVAAVDTIVYALRPGPVEGNGPPFNPLGISGMRASLDQATGVLGSLIGLLAVVVLVDAIARFVRSRGVERQQFRWFALAAASFPLLFLIAITFSAGLPESTFDPVVLVFLLCGNGLAAAIGVAVTRHGLYEINRVVSRTVTYALLTALLAAVYLGGVTLLTSRAPLTDKSPVAVAAATLAAAAVFGPARRRIQELVDRRFNRSRYDAAVTIESYRARLRDEVDLAMLVSELTRTVAASMQPATSALWLAQGGAGPEKVSPDPSPVTVPERNRETRGLL